MNIDFNDLEKRLNPMVACLPEEIDRSWLIAVLSPFKKAYALNYQRNDISRLDKNDQDRLLIRITALNFNHSNRLTKEENI